MIGLQGVALVQAEKAGLFRPRQLAGGATILIIRIGGGGVCGRFDSGWERAITSNCDTCTGWYSAGWDVALRSGMRETGRR